MAEPYQLGFQGPCNCAASLVFCPPQGLPGQCWIHWHLDLDEPTEYVINRVGQHYEIELIRDSACKLCCWCHLRHPHFVQIPASQDRIRQLCICLQIVPSRQRSDR